MAKPEIENFGVLRGGNVRAPVGPAPIEPSPAPCGKQAYLTRRLRERDLGRNLEGTKITLNEYLDRWIETAVKPRVREKGCQDYEGLLRRYIRLNLGDRLLTALRPRDLQTTYQQMMERGLFARTTRYTHAVLRSAMRQALNWRLLLERSVDGLKLPQQSRHEMQGLTVEQVRMLVNAALATPHGPVLAVAVATGMRPSEYLGLKWQDIVRWFIARRASCYAGWRELLKPKT